MLPIRYRYIVHNDNGNENKFIAKVYKEKPFEMQYMTFISYETRKHIEESTLSTKAEVEFMSPKYI